MKFDKSKVYTALNADELEVGSVVILADYLDLLRGQVETNSHSVFNRRLDGVMSASSTNRFKSGDKAYNLAYLVRKVGEEEPKEKKWIVYLARYQDGLTLCCCDESYWKTAKKFDGAKTKLFVGSKDEAKEWCNSREKFIEVIRAWEDGKTIQVYETLFKKWSDCAGTLEWYTDCEYRVKPDGLVWTDLKVGNILRRAGERPAPLGGRGDYVHVEERRMVTGIVDDPGTKHHVQLGCSWIDDEDLEKWSIAE